MRLFHPTRCMSSSNKPLQYPCLRLWIIFKHQLNISAFPRPDPDWFLEHLESLEGILVMSRDVLAPANAVLKTLAPLLLFKSKGYSRRRKESIKETTTVFGKRLKHKPTRTWTL